MSHAERLIRRLVASMGLALALCAPQPAASQENAKPKPIFVLIYVDRDFPKDWIAMSQHEDYGKALEALNGLAKTEGIIGLDIVPVDPKTGKSVPWPSDVPKLDQPREKVPDLPKELPARKSILVRVYKDGVEQLDKKLETDKDYERAKEYFDRVNRTPGWKATWNAPGWPRPDLSIPKMNWVDIGPYNPPKEAAMTKLEGTKWGNHDRVEFEFGDGGKVTWMLIPIPAEGKWAKSGQTVSLEFKNVGSTSSFFELTLKGKTLEGTQKYVFHSAMGDEVTNRPFKSSLIEKK